MIIACFLTPPDGHALGFRITGHARGTAGTDIVCAAVSSAAYLTANTITGVLGIEPMELRAAGGDMSLRLRPGDEPACRALLLGLRLHLKGLEEQYPEDIRVGHMRI